ncbi:MAG: GGDEF domain-containing protein, partial [Oscillospiraceae bacterium]
CSTYCNLSYSQLIENTEKIWIYKDDHKKYFKTLNRENLIECYKKGKQSLNLQYRAKINKEKDYIWVNSNINMILDDKTNHILCTWTTQNINEKKLAEISLKEQAQTDDLTGLLNRQTFENKINNFFSNNQQGAFFMLDVDDFKMINDSYGHTFGDKVLNEISYTLANVFKENAYTARLGGDEFAVFAENIVSIDQGRNKAEEICKAIENILDKSSYRCNISCSVGVAFAPENGTTFHQLYTNADLAQYHAKHTGKNKYYIFDKVCESMNYEWIKDSKWVLDNIDASVYVCDKENFNILFINDYMCKKLEVEKNQCIGEKCYKIFMNRDEPCPFCSSPKIKKHVTFSRTFYLARYKSTILLRGKEILWNNIPARIETAVNITDIVKDI